MEFITQLWLPILLSAAAVFVAGSVLNMVLPHHRKDYMRLPDEDAMRAAIQAQKLARAQYAIPYAHSKEDWNSPEVRQKFQTGPVGLLVIGRNTAGMSRQLIAQGVYVLCVSLMVAYVASAALFTVDAPTYLKVFQVTGATATLAYSAALFTSSIWFHVPWGNTVRHALDGLVYGLLTAGFFGWLW